MLRCDRRHFGPRKASDGQCGKYAKLLLDLRADVVTAGKASLIERLAFRMFAWVARRPRVWEFGGKVLSGLAPDAEPNGWIRRLPWFAKIEPLKLWTQERDLPPPARQSFREQWRTRGQHNVA